MTETKDSEGEKLPEPKSRQHFCASLNFDASTRFICLVGEGSVQSQVNLNKYTARSLSQAQVDKKSLPGST